MSSILDATPSLTFFGAFIVFHFIMGSTSKLLKFNKLGFSCILLIYAGFVNERTN